MSPVGGRTVLTLKDLYCASLFSRSPWALALYGVLLLLAWGHAFWFDPPGAATTTFVIALAATVGLAGLWLAFVAFFSRRMSAAQKRLTCDIDRERIAVRDDSGAASIVPWSHVRKCREHAAGLALFTRPAGFRWLVKRAFSADDWQVVCSLARSNVGKPAREVLARRDENHMPLEGAETRK